MRMHRTADLCARPGLWLLACLVLCWACEESSTGAGDASPGDGAVIDAARMDAHTADARVVDASVEGDGAAPDANLADAGATDAGPDLAEARTTAQLEAFFSAHGGQAAFPRSYVDAVEAMLRAEDEVVAGDFAAARARLDALFGAYPLSDPVWWNGVDRFGLNVGTPVAYYGARMLDTIADIGLEQAQAPVEPLGALRLTVAIATCATGQQPADAALETTRPVELTVDPRLAADDYRVVHQALRLFRVYVWALTEGRWILEVDIQPVEACAEVTFRPIEVLPGRVVASAGLVSAASVVAELPEAVHQQTDMWWVLYPSNVPTDPVFADAEFVTGGMGGLGAAPLFIVDDLWLVRTPPHLGTAEYDDVQRRVYLPQWLQHEFYHHLFRTWPEFGLEDTSHQWFDRGTWPADFVGSWEPDYYAEAFNKRLRGAEPPIWSALRTRPADVSGLSAADLAGSYQRQPVENPWHEVTVTVIDEARLTWSNAAGVSWGLTWEAGELRSVADSPYGAQRLQIDAEEDAMGRAVPPIRGLFFNGELYRRQPGEP